MVWNRALTAAEVNQVQRAGPPGIPGRRSVLKITAVGASNCVPNSFIEHALQNLQVGVQWTNLAISGQTFQFFDTNFVGQVQSGFDPNTTVNLLVLQCTNDMDFTPGISDTAALALAESIASKWKALGPSAKVILFGAWNFGGDAAFIQVHHDFNTAAKALPLGAPFDGFVDVWNIPGLNTGTTVATSLSPDNNHLTQAGHILVEPYYRAVVDQVWSR